ncbi:MAG: hypothetical protein CFE43_20605 [Burkholderiales bacterium PBB3]|nr:MAG: hypothetical protein CFE43_20605 [Burkholderiales bacterium PBB3]
MRAFVQFIAAGVLSLLASAAMAATVTNAQVFAYVAANFPAVFSGAATAGQFQQYDYRLYPATGNVVAVDTVGQLYALGPVTNNLLTAIGPVSAFADQILAWAATQPRSGLVGGAVQGTALNLAAAVTSFAGRNGFNGVDNGSALTATFNAPTDITTDGTNLFILDKSNARIRKIVIATGAVSSLAGNGLAGHVDGAGALASFYAPQGITTDGTHVFVSEEGLVRKVVIATGVVTTLAGRCATPCPTQPAAGALAVLEYIQGITTDGTHVFVASRSTHSIYKIAIATGQTSVLAGGGGPGNQHQGNANGIGTAAAFNVPWGLTTDGGYVYVTESGQIRKIAIATGLVSTVVSALTTPFVLDDKGEASALGTHLGITTDGTYLYATQGTRVRKILIATGATVTLAGSGVDASGVRGNIDGTGSAATFAQLSGIVTDGSSLFLTDGQLHLIRQVK